MPLTKCPHCRMRIRTADPPLFCPRCLVRGLGRFELVAFSVDRKLGTRGRPESSPEGRPSRSRVPPRLEQTVIWAESIQITVKGDLDRAGIGALRRLLADAVGSGPPCVVLDLATCGYLDAGALRVIVGLERRLAANGQELVLDGATGQVERLIASAGAISARARLPQLR